jgi:hypothetical protein
MSFQPSVTGYTTSPSRSNVITVLTAFTDGCPGLRHNLADASITTTPILDWFHIGMRLQRLRQIAGALSAHPPRVAAKAVVVAEVERLHWRIWNAKANNAWKSIDRIRAVMSHFRGEAGGRKSIAPSRKLWTALHALDGYPRPERLAGELCRAAPRCFARWNRTHRTDGQFPGEPPNE